MPILPADTPLDTHPAGGGGRVLPADTKLDESTAEKPSFLSNVGSGLLDKFYGMAQLGAHVGGASDTGFGPEISPEAVKAVDETIRKRDADLKASGAAGSWGRTAGNLLGDIAVTAPLTALGGGGGFVSGLLGGAAGGALASATDPVTGGNFERAKMGQAVTGAAVGGTLGGAFGGVEKAVRSFLTPVEQQASNLVVKRLTQDAKAGGPTADDALKAVAEHQASGKPMTLADVGGENTKGLAGYVARQPGESRSIASSTLTDRDKDAANRLTADVEHYISGGPSVYQTTQALLTARSQAARPLYQQAESLQNIWSPRLQEFLDNSDVKRGMARGYRLERLEALAEGRPFNPTQMGIDLDAEGNIKLLRVPNLRVLDMGKRGLDAMIADERDAMTGRLSALGRSLDMARRAYVQEIDGLDTGGIYRSAREAWAGPSASLDAVRFGKTIFNRNPEETAAALSRMSPNDQEFARLGVADVLRERIAKTGFGGNEARAIIKNPWTEAQLRPLFDSENKFSKFVDAVMAEHTMAETTKKVLGGSPTASRLAEDQSVTARLALHTARLAHSIGVGSPLGTLHHAMAMRHYMGLKSDDSLNEAIAKLLFSDKPQFLTPPPSRAISKTAAPVLGGVTGERASSALGF